MDWLLRDLVFGFAKTDKGDDKGFVKGYTDRKKIKGVCYEKRYV